jgi:predicted nucleic acid-binding protein
VIHLDTNILIFATDPQHRVRAQLQSWLAQGEHLGVSSMAWAEFRCGPVTEALINSWQQLLGAHIVAVDRAVAELAADLFNASGRRSRSLPDCLIAATAIRADARLATLNEQDFAPFLSHGLLLA